MTLTPLNEVKNSIIDSYSGYLFEYHNPFGNTKWIIPYGIYHRNRKRYGFQYCPNCLIKDEEVPYYRKHWRLSLFICCPKCGIQLHENCPQCTAPVIYFRTLFAKKEINRMSIKHCHICNFDLSLAPQIKNKAINTLVSFQKKVHLILNNGFSKDIHYSHLYFDVLHQLLKILNSTNKFSIAIRKEICKNSNIPYKKIIGNKILPFDFLPISERIYLFTLLTWLIHNWPNRIIKICKKHKVHNSYMLKDFSPPFWYFKIFRDY